MKPALLPLVALIYLLAILLGPAPLHGAFLIFPDGGAPTENGVKAALEAYQRGDFPEAVERFKTEATRGDREAQFALARLYEEGSGVAYSLTDAETLYRQAAAQGHPGAQSNLAILLLNSQRTPEGLDWLRKAAAAGAAPAMTLLGNLSLTGNGLPKNEKDAKTWLTKAADLGDADALASLSLMAETGTALPKDPAKALDLLQKAAERNSVKALLRLAMKRLKGDGLPKDGAQTISLLTRAANLGSTEATLALGTLYETGESVEKNLATALKWYRQAADAGDSTASLKLGVLYSEGSKDIPQDDTKALQAFLRSAELGQPAAMYNVGTYFEKGRGAAPNPTESFKWHLKAALSGLSLAQREIGLRYRTGRGVQTDTVVALSWLSRAATAGDADAALTLADMLLAGEGGLPPNPTNAIAILTRASELGLPAAQVRLASLYASSPTAPPADLIRAYALTLAAGPDFPPALKLKSELATKLTPTQITEAKAELTRLKAKPKGEDKAPPN